MHKMNEVLEILENSIFEKFENGIEKVDAKEMSCAIDMLKDITCSMKDYAIYDEMKHRSSDGYEVSNTEKMRENFVMSRTVSDLNAYMDALASEMREYGNEMPEMRNAIRTKLVELSNRI